MRSACLFAGIGGWELAAQQCGIEMVWAAEWDEWKAARYRERFPNVTLYGDVEQLDGRSLRRSHGDIDFLFGSPPCTDISAANHRGEGVDGDESRLYFEAVRLADEIRPRWVCFENSDRLRVRGADRVCAALESAGYACWPLVVAAGHAGAPHIRRRSWLVAADAERAGLRDKPGRRGGTVGQGKAEPQDDADADIDGQSRLSVDAEMGGGKGAHGASAKRSQSRIPANARIEQGEFGGRFDGAETLAGCRSDAGNGTTPWTSPRDSLARHVRVADGVPAWLARKWRSAYGDAVVVPVVAAIIRGIVRVDQQGLAA